MRAMPTWRCPHCGTPQDEAARCWVCRRSYTACGTCRHFRRSVAAQLGYCGLDPRRAPLAGDEIRGCWESSPVLAIAPAGSARLPTPLAEGRRRGLDFIEVSGGGPSEIPAPAATPDPLLPPPPAEPGWSLWGDADL
jgi:hypothetical protein